VLMDCVDGGASVDFMQILPRVQAERFWRGLAYDVALGKRIILVAEMSTSIFYKPLPMSR
jgi:hypothetical protein